MTLLEFTANLTALVEQQTRTAAATERIADALERLSPPLRDFSTSAPYKAQVSDLLDCSDEAVGARREAQEEFAARSGVMPDSDAFRAKVKEFEDLVRQSYGQDVEDGEKAVQELPWNK